MPPAPLKAFSIGMCPSMSKSVPPKFLWTLYLINQREFHPILVIDVFRFIAVSIRLWDQKVKGQGHNRQWPKSGRISYDIFITIWANFAKIMYLDWLGWLRSTVGRTPVFGRWTDPVLALGLQRTGDHYVGKPSATGQPTRPTQPFILPGSINE